MKVFTAAFTLSGSISPYSLKLILMISIGMQATMILIGISTSNLLFLVTFYPLVEALLLILRYTRHLYYGKVTESQC